MATILHLPFRPAAQARLDLVRVVTRFEARGKRLRPEVLALLLPATAAHARAVREWHAALVLSRGAP
jgi:hypothetical protein